MEEMKGRREKEHNLFSDEKGSAIIMVIIIMAFVGILVAIIMWMSMTNYMMKATDRGAKNNFYSSETVMEQILAGLQEEASAALEDSYQVVMQRYSELSASNRQNVFCTRYLNDIRTSLEKTGMPGTYDINKLITYIDPEFFADGAHEPYVVKADFISAAAPYKMDVYNDHIILRDVTVSFTDYKTDYTSVITTDFCIDVPNMDFTQSSAMPQLFSFSMVANDKLIVQPNGISGIKADIFGNLYGGENGIEIGEYNTVTMQKADYIITDGTISLNGIGIADNSASLTIGETGCNTALWAKGFSIQGGQLTTNGRAYLQNDLSIDGTGGKAILNGAYYGYGISESEADKSSAILINSKNAELDLSNLKEIMIGGHAYVGTGSITGKNGETNQDIMMGESIAVKGDQIAYLVPPSLIGVKTVDGESSIEYGKNPLTGSEYSQLLKDIEDNKNKAGIQFEEVALNQPSSRLSGATLSYYGASYQKVFVPFQGDSLVYYYLTMSREKAEEFFRDYYGLEYNKTLLDRYFKFYTKGIKFQDNLETYSRINIEGNWLTDAADGTGAVLKDPITVSSDRISAEASKYEKMFAGYCTKLMPDYENMSDDEKAKSVFDNLILTDKLKSYTGHGGRKVFKKDGSNLNAVLADRSVNYPSDSFVNSNTRLIVATGDVTISSDFDGLVIAGGKVTITGGANVSITPDEEALARVLQYTDAADDSIKPIGFFVKGSNYVLEGVSVSGNSADSTGKVNLNEVVRYENWKKK